MTSTDQKVQTEPAVTAGRVMEIVFDAAITSLINGFLVVLLGGIALDIVCSLTREMTPSAPPGVHWESASASWTSWMSSVTQYRFLICSALFFVPMTWFRLSNLFRPSGEVASKRMTRVERIGQQLADGWFGLVIGNAFGAMVAAIVIGWTTQFSLTQMIFHTLLDWALPGIHVAVGWLLGESMTATLGDWLSWYGQNQLKFTFWFLYVASVCDDLGVPNFKSLARWAFRRYRRMNRQQASSVELRS